jgi:hypothetical protein
MQFNFGAGIAAGAKAAADQYAKVSLEDQKADLENQKIQLADQLAGARESAGRKEAAGYAEKAAEKEQGFRTGLETLHETHADIRYAKEQEEQTKRDAATNARMTTLSAAEINAANSRTDKEIGSRVALAKEAARTAEEKDIIDGIVKANTEKIPLIDKTGAPVLGSNDQPLYETRVNTEKVAGILRDTGHFAAANHFDPTPPKPATPAALLGKPNVSWNAAKGQFRDATGTLYDRNGAEIKAK